MLPLALLLIALALALEATSTQTETRQTRSDVRNMMEKLDPNFWPTRGRRSSTSSEETPPPFWANRGRTIGSLLVDRGLQHVSSDETAPAPPFWAHRGRDSPCPDKGVLKSLLSVEEPRWVMFNRREADDGGNADSFWITQGPPGIDDLSSREHEFWVSRGKKLRSEKKDSVPSLYAQQADFYPSRGRRQSS